MSERNDTLWIFKLSSTESLANTISMQISLVYALAFSYLCSYIVLQRTSEHSNGLQRTTFSFGYHADAQESTSIPSYNRITKAKLFVSQTSGMSLYQC